MNQRRRYQTTADVEAHYRVHPGDRAGTRFPWWLKIVLVAAGAVMVAGVVLAAVG